MGAFSSITNITLFVLHSILFLFLFSRGVLSISTSTNTNTNTCQISSLSPSLSPPLLLRSVVTEAAQKEIDSDSYDISGILWMEHVNMVVGNREQAEYFYRDLLGFNRDETTDYLHMNLGQQQFHLELDEDFSPNRIAGGIGLVVPDLQTVKARIPTALNDLKDTQFQILSDNDDADDDDCLVLQGPWGNTFYVYDVLGDSKPSYFIPAPASSRLMENLHAVGNFYGSHRMAVRGKPGIRFLELACPPGKSSKVAAFYKKLLGCSVQEFNNKKQDGSNHDSVGVVVSVGPGVHLVFVERSLDDPIKSQDDMKGVHVCFYVNNFEQLYKDLSNRGLIRTNPRFTQFDSCDTWEEAKASRTLRFTDIVDLDTNEKIIELEHETRPLRHGQYLKTINYNPK